MTDAIELTGIHCYGYHGHHAEERTLGQRFLVDLRLYLDLAPAGTSDDLTQGVDYSAAVQLVRKMVEGESRQLIESVAEAVAAGLLHAFPALTGVDVCLHKPNAPIPGPPVADVAVRVHRLRGVKRVGERRPGSA